MRKEIHEQPRADRRLDAGPSRRRTGGSSSTRSGSARSELREIDKIIVIACGTVVLRRHGRQVRHRALDPDPVRGRARPRVPLPRPDPDPGHAGRGDQPVRRDRGHADGDPARPRAALQGAGDLQHQRLDDPAGVRRGDLHPRRPGDRGGLHQGLHDPAGRLLPAGALPRPGARHQVRRRDRLRSSRELETMPDARPAGARRGRAGLRPGPRAGRRAGRCCSSAGTPATRSPWRAR